MYGTDTKNTQIQNNNSVQQSVVQCGDPTYDTWL